LGLYESSYTMKLRYIAGAGSQLDYVEFDCVVPTETRSWGAVKALYLD